MFMNNRIGTILSKVEQENIVKIGKKFKTGDMIVYEESADVYKFVVYVASRGDTSRIVIGSNNSIVDMDVPNGNLYEYSKLQPIKQDYKPNEVKLEESEMLETYNL